jgi:hypothetical protein
MMRHLSNKMGVSTIIVIISTILVLLPTLFDNVNNGVMAQASGCCWAKEGQRYQWNITYQFSRC